MVTGSLVYLCRYAYSVLSDEGEEPVTNDAL